MGIIVIMIMITIMIIVILPAYLDRRKEVRFKLTTNISAMAEKGSICIPFSLSSD